MAARSSPGYRLLSLALAVSVAFHTALLLLVWSLVSGVAERSTSDGIVLVGLQLGRPETPGGSRPGAASDHRVRNGEAAIGTGASGSIDRGVSPRLGREEGTAQGLDAGPAEVEDRAERAERELPEPAVPPAVESDVVVAAPTFETAEPAKPLKEPEDARAGTLVSRQQERMLQRRLAKWSESFPRIQQGDASVTWRDGGRDYTARFTRLPAGDDTGIERVLVQVSTEEDGTRYSTGIVMKRLSFSSFAQFVNRWDPVVHLHDDELDGRFHSNTQINLYCTRRASPRFRGKVTTAAQSINLASGGRYVAREQVFLGGLETGVRVIPLPGHFAGQEGARDDQMRTFEVDTRISFHPDGSYGWKALADDGAERRAPLSAECSYFLAAEGAQLYVRGTVNGKVLVYSPEGIVIEGDLVYADDPLANPDADDLLGLVSDKSVDVAPPEVTGAGDLSIQAAIYAKHRFTVQHHMTGTTALLQIYGSLTVDSMAATEPRYATKIRFDPRLESLRPPSFPMTDRYEVDSWDRTWAVSRSGPP